MLTQEEVSDILEEFERQKQKKGANAGGSSEDLRVSLSSSPTKPSLQRASLAAKVGVPNATIFIENDQCDLNNHENNESKPFYVVRRKTSLNKFYFSRLTSINSTATTPMPQLHQMKPKNAKWLI